MKQEQGTPYHRNIVVFSDGTGNSSAQLFRTNVWRTYHSVDLKDPSDLANPRQFAFYDDGVGTSSFKPLALLGGAIGLGLGRNVKDLYAFVCRTYRPADPKQNRAADKIYAFGFSRGAFTIRVLVGLIATQGLVPYDGDEAELQRRVAAAYRNYRAERYGTKRPHVRLIRELRDFLLRRKKYPKSLNIGSPDGPSDDRVRIAFVGVWDTVAAYGLPIDELTLAVDKFIWPLSMPDRDLSSQVDRAMHALSLDDERNTFHPQLWNEGASKDGGIAANGGRKATTVEEERLSQVWFAGVHANLGGGYPDDTLSLVPLNWIMRGAAAAGLRFSQPIWDEYCRLADENGVIYDSRKGLAGYYRYNPRRIEHLTRTRNVKVEVPKIHESVFRRIAVGHDGYAPIVIPAHFAVATIAQPSGTSTIVPAADYLKLGRDRAAVYERDREHVWNWVWWRRLMYFATLAATLVLAAAPLIQPPLEKGACTSGFCFLSEGVGVLSIVLPGFAAVWTDTVASHPEWLLLAAAIGAGLWFGSSLDVATRNAMRNAWYAIPVTRPPAPPAGKPAFRAPQEPGRLNRALQRIRTWRYYRPTFKMITRGLLPFAFVLVVGLGVYALASRIVFSIRDANGFVCIGTPSPAKVSELPVETAAFRTGQLCAATGLLVEKGGTYRIRFKIPKEDRWQDSTLPAGPTGVYTDKLPAWMAAFVPVRRRVNQPWYKPIGRIGAKGTDDYPLDTLPSIPEATTHPDPPTDISFESEVVARTTGELFLYVNDGIPLGLTAWLYGNNRGSAAVTVQQVLRRP